MAQKLSPKDYNRWDGKVGIKVTSGSTKASPAKPKAKTSKPKKTK